MTKTPDNNVLMNVQETIIKAPLVLAWSLTPNTFWNVEQLKDEDDTQYHIVKVEGSEMEMNKLIEHYSKNDWEVSLVDCFFKIAAAVKELVPGYKEKDNAMTILAPNIEKFSTLFSKLVDNCNVNIPMHESSNVHYFGSIKINDQLYFVRFHNDLHEDVVLVGMYDLYGDCFNASLPIGKIIIKD
jgi:hypothetical protein